jgi:hypothetical protein
MGGVELEGMRMGDFRSVKVPGSTDEGLGWLAGWLGSSGLVRVGLLSQESVCGSCKRHVNYLTCSVPCVMLFPVSS